jgi:hypothetical protein
LLHGKSYRKSISNNEEAKIDMSDELGGTTQKIILPSFLTSEYNYKISTFGLHLLEIKSKCQQPVFDIEAIIIKAFNNKDQDIKDRPILDNHHFRLEKYETEYGLLYTLPDNVANLVNEFFNRHNGLLKLAFSSEDLDSDEFFDIEKASLYGPYGSRTSMIQVECRQYRMSTFLITWSACSDGPIFIKFCDRYGQHLFLLQICQR